MPLIFRAMLADGDMPKIGPSAKLLGVRVAPQKPADIPVSAQGTVLPRTEGMSVAPSIGKLPHHRIPVRLRSRFPRATGDPKLICWKMGEGPFAEAQIS